MIGEQSVLHESWILSLISLTSSWLNRLFSSHPGLTSQCVILGLFYLCFHPPAALELVK